MRNLLAVSLMSGMVLGVAAAPARAVDRDAVNRAVDRGVTALRGLQAADGTWPYTEIGATALGGLTLLECGAAADDKAVLRAADVLRNASVSLTHNYSIALSILFFDRLGDPADFPLIESLTVRLLAGQTTSGGWNYRCPAISPAEVRRLQNHLAGHKELVGRRELPKPGTVKRTAKDLPKEIHQQLALINHMGGGLAIGSDNSNTQFATLALWVAHRYGLPVGHALTRVEERFRGSQQADGGWGYFDRGAMRGRMAGSTASMTCAGLLGLAVADGNYSEMVRAKKPGSTFKRDINKDANLRRGLLALSTTISQPVGAARRQRGERVQVARVGGRTYYFLWSLERVAVALDLKTIGKKDWYAWGAEVLLANQQAGGSWQGNYADCGADTCFALLFLKRANLVPDLTTQLTGKIDDPGERFLKPGGVGGDALSGTTIADLQPGIESKEAKPITKPLQDATGKPEPSDSPGGRMAGDLVKASGTRQDQLLKQMRDGKGVLFTEALAHAIPRLAGDKQQKARTALAERLTRMKGETLTSYLKDEDVEIRRAAALACARKDSPTFIPALIPLLRDPERLVVEAAHAALKDLTGRDFGPPPDANREARDRAVRKWLDWWSKQERSREQKD